MASFVFSEKEIKKMTATDKRGYPHNIFLISPQKHMLWYSLEAPRRGASNEYPQHMFSWRNKKDISIFRMKKAPYLLLCIESVSRQQRPISACTNAQADQDVCCPEIA